MPKHRVVGVSPAQTSRAFAFINTEDDKDWSDQLDMFEASLQLPAGTVWDTFDAFGGRLPSKADLEHKYQGMLICGSHLNVDEPLDWIANLLDIVRICASLPLVRIVGICFGCQIVAAALGGKVGPNACGGYVYRNERVHVAPMLQAMLAEAASTDAVPPSSLHLLATHGSCVLQLPPDAERLGWSEGSPNEWFFAGPHRTALCCQGHPEYTVALLKDRVSPKIAGAGTLTVTELTAVEESFDRPLDSRAACALLRTFLLQGPPTFHLSSGCGGESKAHPQHLFAASA